MRSHTKCEHAYGNRNTYHAFSTCEIFAASCALLASEQLDDGAALPVGWREPNYECHNLNVLDVPDTVENILVLIASKA